MRHEQLLASLDEEWERGSMPNGFHVGHTGGMRELSDEELIQEACKTLHRTPFYTEETRNEIEEWIRKRDLEIDLPSETHEHECRRVSSPRERGRMGGRPARPTCKRGHRMEGHNLLWKKRGDTRVRECRACHNLRRRKYGYGRKSNRRGRVRAA